MGLFDKFKTDKALEKGGIVYTPDSHTAVTLARAGGANKRFDKLLEAKSKPYRRQINAGTLDNDIALAMMREVYADTIIRKWETLIGAEGEEHLIEGIQADENNLDAYEGEGVMHDTATEEMTVVPYNRHNVLLTLKALPDLFLDIQAQASELSGYLETMREDDSGN